MCYVSSFPAGLSNVQIPADHPNFSQIAVAIPAVLPIRVSNEFRRPFLRFIIAKWDKNLPLSQRYYLFHGPLA